MEYFFADHDLEAPAKCRGVFFYMVERGAGATLYRETKQVVVSFKDQIAVYKLVNVDELDSCAVNSTKRFMKEA